MDDVLTTWVIGTEYGRMQMDPGICFHPGYVISHTQYACIIDMTNSTPKNAATPEDEGSVRHKKGVRIFVHCRILLCICQGVIRTTVNTIEILPPLQNDELNIPGWGKQRGLTKLGYKNRR